MLTHTSPSGADTCPGEGGVPTRPHDYGSWDRVCEHVGLRGVISPHGDMRHVDYRMPSWRLNAMMCISVCIHIISVVQIPDPKGPYPEGSRAVYLPVDVTTHDPWVSG